MAQSTLANLDPRLTSTTSWLEDSRSWYKAFTSKAKESMVCLKVLDKREEETRLQQTRPITETIRFLDYLSFIKPSPSLHIQTQQQIINDPRFTNLHCAREDGTRSRQTRSSINWTRQGSQSIRIINSEILVRNHTTALST